MILVIFSKSKKPPHDIVNGQPYKLSPPWTHNQCSFFPVHVILKSSSCNTFAREKNPDRGWCQMFPAANSAEARQSLNICGGVLTEKRKCSTKFERQLHISYCYI